MGHFKSNLRDIEFNLFEVLRRQDLLGPQPYPELDEETARGILDEVNRLATGPLAESFADADRNPPVFDPATALGAHARGASSKSYQAFIDAEWFRLDLPAELGGTGAPRSLDWAVAELILGANPAVWMYSGGPTFAPVLWELGTPEQKRFAEQAIERRWTATMVLTEPDAGSDVGAGRTRAIQQRDGTWHIEGVKRFITSAEHDLAENIFHLVLARPEGAGPGTKGLSMFLVPKYLVDADGDAGRAQRRLRHQRRAQDGPQGLHHLRADLRRRPPGGRHPGRRRARRHPADVHDHRVRPDDGRHQGHRHPVHRLPERAGVRQEPGAGRRPDPDDRQDRAAGHDHPPPRRAPDADAAEGLRRGHAGAGPVHGDASRTRCRSPPAGGGTDEQAAGAQRPAAAGGQGGRLRAGLRAADAVPADARRLGVPAGLPDRAVHPGRQDRQPLRGHHRRSRASTCSSARSSGTRARRCGRCSARSRSSPSARRGNGRLKPERTALAGAAGRRRGDGRHHGRLPGWPPGAARPRSTGPG